MESLSVRIKHSLLFVTLIYAILYFLHAQVSHKLIINHQAVRVKKSPLLPLRFRYDGTFKILQVADMHYGNGLVSRCRDVLPSEFENCSNVNTTLFLKRMIQAENPDFVAFTGDNIFGSSTPDAAESLLGAFGPVMESGIPWAVVLGNHDHESTMTREELMSFISLLDYSISQTSPSIQDKGDVLTDIDGFGNYNHGVYGAPASHMANNSILNLFFLDSGDRETVQGVRTYGWIKERQLRWLHAVAQDLKAQKQNGMAVPALSPAMVFFHIPIPEVQHLYYQKVIGQFQEAVACSSVNSGVLQALLSIGDVKAVFIGHDHKNDFCGNLEGIWFCYGGGFGYHGYGRRGWPRRARIILAELGKDSTSWIGVERIRTWKRLDDERLSKIDEQILWDLQPSK